jgi:hypothetical protein
MCSAFARRVTVVVAVFLVSCVFAREAHAYRSCKAILSAGASVGDGVYTIDPDDGGPLGSVDVYCENDPTTHVIEFQVK